LLLCLRLETPNDRRIIIFAGLLAVVALVLALGKHTPIYRLAYLIPGFDRFRAPSKIIVLWAFSMGLLAGKGVDGLLSPRERRLRILDWREWAFLIVLVSMVAIDVILRFDDSVSLSLFSWFILKEAIPEKMALASKIIGGQFHLLAIFGFFSFSLIILTRKKLLSNKPASVLFSALLIINLSCTLNRAIINNDKYYALISRIKKDIRNSLGKDQEIYRVGSYRSPYGSNFEMYLGLQTVGGFTALFPTRYYEYINVYSEYKLPQGWVNLYFGVTRHQKLMDLLNVKYEIFHAEKRYALRDSYLPRAFMVPEYRILEKEEMLVHMTQDEFQPSRTVLFEKGDFRPAIALSFPKAPQPKSDVRILSYGPDEIVLRVESSFPGFLFLSEIYYPGWKCFVDDRRRGILRGNYLFRVIQLREGSHRVRLVFDPWTVKAGIGITLLTFFLFVLILVHHRLRNRKE